MRKFCKLVDDILNQGEGIQFYDMNHRFVHQLINCLETIFNNEPNIIRQEAYFFNAFKQIFENRQSVEYIKELGFLKTPKLQGQIWLLLEISDLSILDIFKEEELLQKYDSNTILKIYIDKIIELLEELSKIFRVQGDIINRWYTYKMKKNQVQCSIEGTTTHRNMRQLKRQQTYDFSDCLFPSKGPTLTNIKIGSGDEIKDDNESEEEENLYTKANSFENNQFSEARRREKEEEKEDNLKESNQLIFEIKSDRLFSQEFEKFTESSAYAKFSIRPQALKKSESNYQCSHCLSTLPRSKCFISRDSRKFCHFSGKWCCSKCMKDDKSIIPWRVIQEFNFKEYPVSRHGHEEIQKMFKLPILQLEYYKDIVFSNRRLHDFLILRRSLHLMYDVICDQSEMAKYPEIWGRRNLLVQMNLFSLEDMKLIQSGQLQTSLKSVYDSVYGHMTKCEKCLKKGFHCLGCRSGKKIFAFEIMATQYCLWCRGLYHRKCHPEERSGCRRCEERKKENEVSDGVVDVK